MWCRGSKDTGLDAVDERATHSTEPVRSGHRIVGHEKRKNDETRDCVVQITGSGKKEQVH